MDMEKGRGGASTSLSMREKGRVGEGESGRRGEREKR